MKQCKRCKQFKSLDNFRLVKQKIRYKDKVYHTENYIPYCRECERKNALEHRNKNLDRARKSSREWREKNPLKAFLATMLWRDENREYTREYARTWSKEHPENVRAAHQTRRARKKNAEGSFTYEEFERLLEQCEYRCLACGSTKNLSADHVVPLSKGGTNYISNIQVLCKRCNSKKKDKTIDYR